MLNNTSKHWGQTTQNSEIQERNHTKPKNRVKCLITPRNTGDKARKTKNTVKYLITPRNAGDKAYKTKPRTVKYVQVFA